MLVLEEKPVEMIRTTISIPREDYDEIRRRNVNLSASVRHFLAEELRVEDDGN
jgi:post-segregation antitoxin (ccd killing protein)